MKTNKNIDRLFQEKLKDFEVSPPDNVWKGIERNLKNSKPKSLIPLWMSIGSVAAILILLTIGGINYFNSQSSDINNDNTIVIDSDNESAPKINKEILKKDILNSTENESLITEVENDDNKDGIRTKVILSDKQQQENTQLANSKKNQQKNTQNTVTAIELKNNLNESNTEIATNNNSLKQNDYPLNKNKSKDNLNSNTKSTNDYSVTTTTDNTGLKNTDDSVSSQPDKIAGNIANQNANSSQSNKITGNIAKESVNKNLTELKDKLLDEKIDLNKAAETENTLAKLEIEAEKLESLENILTENVEEEKEVDENTKKWSVASVFAPIAYNSFNTKGSPLDLKFENSPKQGSKTMSYGVKVGYRINKKLSLQSGITMVDVGYKIGDVFISPSQQGLQRLTNVNYSSAANILNVQAGDILNNIQLETTSSVPIKGVLNQVFGYIEIPLELKYKLNNSQKIGVNLIGGFSTLILNKNEVFVETSEFSSNLGEANNLNNVNFSGNLGIDLDYKINKNLYFNVAPMLKIHTSTFSKNADNFKPYILGVYTGLNYKF
ncbi:MAG: hypothetical protein COA67_04555 [Lutibacter sp.]|nr:MAG: hypothetical protein COA67_04555 [Lutibacter sp.]